MAEAVEFQGIAHVTKVPAGGMITLRAAPEAASALATAGKRLDVSMPGPLRAILKDGQGLLWMSPDELLMLCDPGDVADHLDALTEAFADHHAMAVDVSDARAHFRITGAHAREVLAKLCPLDMSPEGFTPGLVRRTKLGQVAAAIWLAENGAFDIVCFRSVADYVLDLLKIAAQPGSEVYLYAQSQEYFRKS